MASFSSRLGCFQACPPVFIHTVAPQREAARRWNTFVGHVIGATAAYPSLFLFGAPHALASMVAGHVTFGRIAASALAVALTRAAQIPPRASHAPAAAPALLITLGRFMMNFKTLIVPLVGLGVATLLCDWGRRAVEQDFQLLRRNRVGQTFDCD